MFFGYKQQGEKIKQNTYHFKPVVLKITTKIETTSKEIIELFHRNKIKILHFYQI